MDFVLKVFKDGNGKFFSVDSLGIKREATSLDSEAAIQASRLGPGEYICVKSNLYSTIKHGTFSAVDLSSCRYRFDKK